MNRKHLWTTFGLGAALVLTTGGSSVAQARDRNDNGANASSSNGTSNDPSSQNNSLKNAATNRNNQNNNQNNTAGENDSEAQHHAALGVALEESDGRLQVVAVLPGSPAARGGIRAGDEITSADGRRVRTARDLIDEIGEKQPGAQVELEILRDGQRQTVKALLASLGSLRRSRAGREGRAGNATAENQNRSNRQGWNSNRGRSSSDDEEPLATDQRDDLSRQVRALQRQVSRLEEEVDELRTNHPGRYSAGFHGNQSRTTWQNEQNSAGGRRRSGYNPGDAGSNRTNTGSVEQPDEYGGDR